MKAKLFLLSLLSLAAVAVAPGPAADEQDVADLTAGSKEHTILITAVREAGLVDMLKGKGPFTLFAPTDAAFKKLGEDKVREIVKSKDQLTRLLLAHIVQGEKVYHKDLLALNGQTLNGHKVAVSGKAVTIGDAKVTRADLSANNGVVHVIDAVLTPTR
ncbi:MAG TPA: fasciclin domain-containing protein [Urbifossiella sp.]|jgi:uncharacterized surface protein with fasciclin (FAS1) repeats|nr:fasciclin domain-containing protein [Urbifossiella sp.]